MRTWWPSPTPNRKPSLPTLDRGEILDVAAGKVRAALTWTRRAAEYQLVFASMLVEDYPQVWKALLAGRIDVFEGSGRLQPDHPPRP